MNDTQTAQQFSYDNDPLYARLKPREKKNGVPGSRGHIPGKWLAILGLLAALGYLWFANGGLQSQIEQNEKQLSGLIDQLQAADAEISAVKQTLLESDAKFSAKLGAQVSRTQALYSQIKQEQAEKQRQVEAVLAQKADASQVDKLRSDAEGIRSGVGEANQKITTVQTEVGGLKEITAQHRHELEEQKRGLTANREEIGSVKGELTTFKKSFERDYLPFELARNGSIQKVGDVALRLDKSSEKSKQFNLDIYVNGQRLQKKNRALNEPIYFYMPGQTKPYEVVIQKVTKNVIAGYLSVPRKT